MNSRIISLGIGSGPFHKRETALSVAHECLATNPVVVTVMKLLRYPSPPSSLQLILFRFQPRNTGHCVGWFRDRPSDISRSFLELFATSPSIKPRVWIHLDKVYKLHLLPLRVKDTGKEGQEQQESFNGEAMFLFPAACVLLYIVERITIDSSRFLIRTILELGRRRRGKREFFEL